MCPYYKKELLLKYLENIVSLYLVDKKQFPFESRYMVYPPNVIFLSNTGSNLQKGRPI